MKVITELSAPSFLIAAPQLRDPNFRRSVILLLEMNEKGAMGLVLSNASEIDTGTFFRSMQLDCMGNPQDSIYVGGPVQTDRAFILHSPAEAGPETEEVLAGVQISYSIESLRRLSHTRPQRMRIYLGYSGWAPDQLADEIGEGAWLVHEASSRLIFGHPSVDPWHEAFREMGIEPGQLIHSNVVH